MPNPKPSVKLACFCEKVLTEKDGVLTLIRIVDQFFVHKVPEKLLEMGADPQIELTLMLALLGNGVIKGEHELSIQLFGPTNKAQPPSTTKVTFPEGPPTAGVNTVVNVSIGVVKNYGDCRIEISFDGDPLTVVPFRLAEGAESPSKTTEPQKPQS